MYVKVYFQIMSYTLQPSEHLRSSLYWDGIDITRTENFVAPLPHSEIITTSQVEFAEDMLMGCALDILKGMYLETDIPVGEDTTSSTAQHPDGTVVILDTERLFHTDNREPAKARRLPPSLGPPIEEPFVSHWVQNQDPNEYDIFAGSEAAYFDNEFYGRTLNWGVLLQAPMARDSLKHGDSWP